MGVVNRRNAVVGWLTLNVAKRVVKRKAKGAAKGAVPSVDLETKRPNRSAVALLVGGAAGLAAFLHRHHHGGHGHDGADEADESS